MDGGKTSTSTADTAQPGEEPWQGRGRGGASPSPETGRPHRLGQLGNDGPPTSNLRPTTADDHSNSKNNDGLKSDKHAVFASIVVSFSLFAL